MFEKGIHNLHENLGRIDMGKKHINFFSNDNKDGVSVVGKLFDKS
jgi:hypothetical protein